jgi:DNA (cytosine-5)-methyltransferase 1
MRYASVCDGIGAAHVAWQPLGWQCSWTSEIEPFPAAVVEHRFGFPNVGDMTKITEEMLDRYGPVDLLVGGTPCQSFSVAGLRGGLADPRGNLALRFVQLAAVMQPKWIVWENVPGVLSSGKGRDFGTFLGALGQLGYGFAYRILDAQWFGVAQRRRRVFVVGYHGDWRRAAAVLFERESVFGNPPTRGKAWEGVARSTAASLTSSGGGVERPGESRGQDDVVLGGPTWRGGDQANSEHCIDHAGTLNCDKWQQGGIVAFHPTQDPISSVDGSTHAMGCGLKGGCCTQAVAFTKAKRAQSNTDDETWVPGEVSPTMSCFDQGDTRATTVVAFPNRTRDGVKVPEVMPGGVVPALTNPGGGGRSDAVNVCAFRENSRNEVAYVDPPQSLVSSGGHPGRGYVGVQIAMAVRRLTPRECERLQGFPDDYTLVEYRKKPAADGPRYRALGNSMAVPVMLWIGERIALVDGK